VVAAFDAEDGKGAVAAALGHWVGGYLTQANRSTPGVFEVMPVTDIVVVARMAVNVCRSNPDSLLESAVAGVLASFQAVAQATETPFIEVQNGQYAVRVRRAVLRQAQIALAEGGFLAAGSADGAYGPRTRQAITEYQTKQGLTVTGVPDTATLITLFVGK
jgi:murein L,D-transpeptidase YcbB/YkuD